MEILNSVSQSTLIKFQFGKAARTPKEVGYYKGSTASTQLLNTEESKINWMLAIRFRKFKTGHHTASVNILAQKISSLTSEDWNQLERVVKYLKADIKIEIKIKKSNVHSQQNELIGYTYVNWAQDRSTEVE